MSVNNLAGCWRAKATTRGRSRCIGGRWRPASGCLGPEHPDTLVSVNNLAGLLASKGDYAGARAAVSAGAGGARAGAGAGASRHAGQREQSGRIAGEQRRLRGRGAAVSAGAGGERAGAGAGASRHAGEREQSGRLLESKGDYAEAEPLYRRALEASERVLGPEHPDTLTSVNNLAGLLRAQRRLRGRGAAVSAGAGGAASGCWGRSIPTR